MKIAQRFIAGDTGTSHDGKSRQGRLNLTKRLGGLYQRYLYRTCSVVPIGTFCIRASKSPGNELPGYSRPSLRDAKRVPLQGGSPLFRGDPPLHKGGLPLQRWGSSQGNIIPAVLLLATCLSVFVGCSRVTNNNNLPIIPQPLEAHPQQGSFSLNDQVTIVVDENASDLVDVGRLLQDILVQEVGLLLAIDEAPPASPVNNAIRLVLAPERDELGPEGYELLITPERVSIRGATPTGVVWGVQSLRQLVELHPSHDKKRADKKAYDLPAVRIVDRPKYAWRGLLLDCSRTFLTIEDLKRYVDLHSLYKMNVLQLHLTDDQGWRLEIRKHPKLTEMSSQFDPRFPGEVGGYYTQEQMRELVQYAALRGVTIVPEIEMPSHCLSLLATYPELSCREGKDKYILVPYLFMSDHSPDKEPKTPYGVLCVGNEKTFQIVEDILDEVIEMFPSKYIHIGADECPKNYWKDCPKCQARMKSEGLENEDQLQSYFIKRVEKIILARGRKLFGWDEILQGGLAPQAAVMAWHSLEEGATAARMHHPVVMSPKSHIFFDYCYNTNSVKEVFGFDPMPKGLTPKQQSLVLGAEACMWTHLARSTWGIDMMVYPRLLALAEATWTPKDRRLWDSFAARLEPHVKMLQAKGINCYVPNAGISLPNISAGQDGKLWLVNAEGKIYLRKGNVWERFPGKARQVTSGSDGTIYAISQQSTVNGYVLMQWSGQDWQPVSNKAAAVQMSAASDGSLWMVTDSYAIYRLADGNWKNFIGLASEVTAGPGGSVWSVSVNPAPGGFKINYSHNNSRWRRAEPLIAGTHIAAGTEGHLWLITDNGQLRHLKDGQWHNRPGQISQLAITKDGTVWALTGDPKTKQILKWTGQAWQPAGRLP